MKGCRRKKIVTRLNASSARKIAAVTVATHTKETLSSLTPAPILGTSSTCPLDGAAVADGELVISALGAEVSVLGPSGSTWRAYPCVSLSDGRSENTSVRG